MVDKLVTRNFGNEQAKTAISLIPNGCLEACNAYEGRCVQGCASDHVNCRHDCTRERAICLGGCY